MKKLFKVLFSLMVVMIIAVFTAIAQGVEVVEDGNFFMDFLTQNIEVIGVLVTWIVLRVVPTKWKDPLLSLINWLISIIPDKKSGGGKH
jgi:hypothetical protein